ncbi:MAG: peptide deformylase [Sulfuricurvum sp.]
MIQALVKYPDPRIRLVSANVRFFNDEFKQWIDDIIDTMKANDLDALSAICIGIQYSVFVLKTDDVYIPYINLRVIKSSNKVIKPETSIYYDGLVTDVARYEDISVIYEDENGNSCVKTMTGEIARSVQREYDYCFGSTLIDRVDKETRIKMDDYLEYGLVASSQSCPVVFVRDYFKRGAKYAMGLIAVSFIVPFFNVLSLQKLAYHIDLYLLASVPVFMIAYFFYALYESRKYKQCTSCQIGNIIGTSAILTLQLVIVSLGVYFWMLP